MTTFGDRFDNIFYDRQIYGRSLLRKKRSNCKLKTYASNTDSRTWSCNIYKRRSNILELHNTFGDQCSGILSWATIFPLICGDAKSGEEEENTMLKSRLLQSLKDLRQVQYPDCNICKKLYEEIECCRNGLPCCHLAAIEREKKYAMCAFFEALYNVIHNCSEFKECFVVCRTWSGDATLGHVGLIKHSFSMNESFQGGIDSNERELMPFSNNNYDFTSTLDDNCTDSHNQEKEERDQVEKQQNCKPCALGFSKLQGSTFDQPLSSDDQQRLVPRRLSPSHSIPSVFNPPATSTPRHSLPTSGNSRRYQEPSQTVKKIPSNGSDSTLYHLNSTEPLGLNSGSEEIQATVDHDKELNSLLELSNSHECQPNNENVELSDYEKQVVSNVSEKLNGIIDKMNQLAEKDCSSQKIISDLKCEIVSLREETEQQKCELNHTNKINEQQQKEISSLKKLEKKMKEISQERSKLKGHLESYATEKSDEIEILKHRQLCLVQEVEKLRLIERHLTDVIDERNQLCNKVVELKHCSKEKDNKLVTLIDKLKRKEDCINKLRKMLNSCLDIKEETMADYNRPMEGQSIADMKIMQEKMTILREKFFQLENVILSQDRCLHEQHNYIIEQEELKLCLQKKVKELTIQQIKFLQGKRDLCSEMRYNETKRVSFME